MFKKVLVGMVAFAALASFGVTQQASLSKTTRAPASFDDEMRVIQKAIALHYGDSATNFEYRTSYNPLLYIGNGAMRALKPITKIPSDRVREYEVMHRVFFKVDGKDMDCYGLVRENRDQPDIYFVNIGTCNQGASEFLDWKTEFSTFITDQE